MSNKKYEIELTKVEVTINNKIHDFINKYNQYPKYLKMPLWISICMKQKMQEIVAYNLDYDTGLILYKNLIICETVAIEKVEEIEVF